MSDVVNQPHDDFNQRKNARGECMIFCHLLCVSARHHYELLLGDVVANEIYETWKNGSASDGDVCQLEVELCRSIEFLSSGSGVKFNDETLSMRSIERDFNELWGWDHKLFTKASNKWMQVFPGRRHEAKSVHYYADGYVLTRQGRK